MTRSFMGFDCTGSTRPQGQRKVGRRELALGFVTAALLGGLAADTVSAQQATSAVGKRWFAHVQYLADDRLEGRVTGSEGYRKAAQYVADHFKQYGREPAGTEGYFQPVKFD